MSLNRDLDSAHLLITCTLLDRAFKMSHHVLLCLPYCASLDVVILNPLCPTALLWTFLICYRFHPGVAHNGRVISNYFIDSFVNNVRLVNLWVEFPCDCLVVNVTSQRSHCWCLRCVWRINQTASLLLSNELPSSRYFRSRRWDFDGRLIDERSR